INVAPGTNVQAPGAVSLTLGNSAELSQSGNTLYFKSLNPAGALPLPIQLTVGEGFVSSLSFSGQPLHITTNLLLNPATTDLTLDSRFFTNGLILRSTVQADGDITARGLSADKLVALGNISVDHIS